VHAYSENVADWQKSKIQSCMERVSLDISLKAICAQFDRYAKAKRSCTGTWAAEHEGKVVGFIAIEREGKSMALINRFYVEPAYWGSNVAPDLFHKAENIFRRNKIKTGFFARRIKSKGAGILCKNGLASHL
jgi:predicted GNAT family acetyltransferase